MEGLSALPDPGTAGIGSLEFGGLQNQGWRGSGSNLREPWDALMQAAFGDSVVARQMKALAALRAGDAQTAHEQTMPIAMDLASFVGNIKPVGGPIRAYHGSPHDFDKFSMDKIGAGEGAQAYGHGLYFAENEGVARNYRDSIGYTSSVRDKRWNAPTGTPDDVAKDAVDLLSGFFGYSDPGYIMQSIRGVARQLPEARRYLAGIEERMKSFPLEMDGGYPEILKKLEKEAASTRQSIAYGEKATRALPFLEKHGVEAFVPPGRMYEVNIHADPERFLDWDKPLSGQNESALAALKETGLNIEKMNGREGLKSIPLPQFGKIMPPPPPLPAPEGGRPLGQIYSAIERTMGADRATAAFRDAGIPGIKYLDAGSRGAGDGTRNYVVFDDKLIEILRKYGIGGILAGGAGAAGIGSLDESGL
jgi:hypothetical protein